MTTENLKMEDIMIAKHEIKIRYIKHLIHLQKEVGKVINFLNQTKNDEKKDIQSTAYITLASLALNSGIPETLEILEGLIENRPFNISILPNSFLIHQRFLAIESWIDKHKPAQIVEIACGFMPHDIRTLKKYPDIKYVGVDFDKIISLKSEINRRKFPDSPQPCYVVGDLYEDKTWESISENIDPNKNTLIFCTGFVMYPDASQWNLFTTHMRKFMCRCPNSVFLHEDTLKAHQELMFKQEFQDLYKKINQISGRNDLQKQGFLSQSQFEKVTWCDRGFKVTSRHPQKLPKTKLNLEKVFDQNDTSFLTDNFKLWEVRLCE